MTAQLHLNGIGESLIASILYGIAILLGERFYSKTANSNPYYRRLRLAGFVLLWLILNLASFVWISGCGLVLLLTSLSLAVVIYKELNQFWRIGIVGADSEVKNGIDYVKSLNMCKNSIRFLGIGASKLTEHRKEFREAIDRCHQTAPVRLLLSRQDAPGLEDFARMAGKEANSYQNKVRESLSFIASLQHEKKNIEVRFYRQFPAFRLMFIDESICLMSYYIMGNGDGSNIPQLHIVKNPGSMNIEALYFGFAAYFEKIWKDADPWNPGDYL